MNITILKTIINGIGFLMTYISWNIPSLLFGIVVMFISILIPEKIGTKKKRCDIKGAKQEC